MTEIGELMKRYDLASLGLNYGFDGSACAWSKEVSDKGYVQIVPPEPGVFWAPSADEAARLLSRHLRAELGSQTLANRPPEYGGES